MSQDKMPALLKAVAGLPISQRGLALGVINTLCAVNRYPDTHKVLKDALKAIRKPVAKVVIEYFDSSKYFFTRKGLLVWPEFASRILPAYKGLIPKRGIKGVEFVNLTRRMHDHDIVAEYLGGIEEARKHSFTPDQLADLVDAQKGGKAGVLLTNGDSTILYMVGIDEELFPVRVSWDSDSSCWDVYSCMFDNVVWFADDRVLRNKN